MRPSKSKIQEVIQAHLHKDEKGEYLSYDEAEQMLEEEILPEFIGITAQYKSSASEKRFVKGALSDVFSIEHKIAAH